MSLWWGVYCEFKESHISCIYHIQDLCNIKLLHSFSLVTNKYTLRNSSHAIHYGLMWLWEFPQFFRGHWQSPCTALTAGKCLPLVLCKETVKESNAVVCYMHYYELYHINQIAVIGCATRWPFALVSISRPYGHLLFGLIWLFTIMYPVKSECMGHNSIFMAL